MAAKSKRNIVLSVIVLLFFGFVHNYAFPLTEQDIQKRKSWVVDTATTYKQQLEKLVDTYDKTNNIVKGIIVYSDKAQIINDFVEGNITRLVDFANDLLSADFLQSGVESLIDRSEMATLLKKNLDDFFRDRDIPLEEVSDIVRDRLSPKLKEDIERFLMEKIHPSSIASSKIKLIASKITEEFTYTLVQHIAAKNISYSALKSSFVVAKKAGITELSKLGQHPIVLAVISAIAVPDMSGSGGIAHNVSVAVDNARKGIDRLRHAITLANSKATAIETVYAELSEGLKYAKDSSDAMANLADVKLYMPIPIPGLFKWGDKTSEEGKEVYTKNSRTIAERIREIEKDLEELKFVKKISITFPQIRIADNNIENISGTLSLMQDDLKNGSLEIKGRIDDGANGGNTQKVQIDVGDGWRDVQGRVNWKYSLRPEENREYRLKFRAMDSEGKAHESLFGTVRLVYASQQKGQDDKALIREVIYGWENAFKNQDLEKAMSYLADSYWYEDEGWDRDRERVAVGVEFKNYDCKKRDPSNVNIKVSGDTATATYNSSEVLVHSTTAAERRWQGVMYLKLRKINGKWLIERERSSP